MAGPSLLGVLAKLKPLDEEFPPISRLAAEPGSDVARLYLLDTNIVSHLVRQPQGPVAEHIANVGEANVLTSVIVACELRYGAAKRGARRLTRQVEAVLGALTIRLLSPMSSASMLRFVWLSRSEELQSALTTVDCGACARDQCDLRHR